MVCDVLVMSLKDIMGGAVHSLFNILAKIKKRRVPQTENTIAATTDLEEEVKLDDLGQWAFQVRGRQASRSYSVVPCLPLRRG